MNDAPVTDPLRAVEFVGLPECQFALAQAAIYLSLAEKSDAAKRAIIAARAHGTLRSIHRDGQPRF